MRANCVKAPRHAHGFNTHLMVRCCCFVCACYCRVLVRCWVSNAFTTVCRSHFLYLSPPDGIKKTEMKCVLGDFYLIIKILIQVYSKPIRGGLYILLKLNHHTSSSSPTGFFVLYILCFFVLESVAKIRASKPSVYRDNII